MCRTWLEKCLFWAIWVSVNHRSPRTACERIPVTQPYYAAWPENFRLWVICVGRFAWACIIYLQLTYVNSLVAVQRIALFPANDLSNRTRSAPTDTARSINSESLKLEISIPLPVFDKSPGLDKYRSLQLSRSALSGHGPVESGKPRRPYP